MTAPTSNPPASAPDQLAQQADAALEQLTSNLLTAQKNQTAACAARYEELLAAAGQVAAHTYQVFATGERGRFVVLRDVATLRGEKPVTPKPLPFAEAIAWVNQHTDAALPAGHDAPLRRDYDPFDHPVPKPKPAPTSTAPSDVHHVT